MQFLLRLMVFIARAPVDVLATALKLSACIPPFDHVESLRADLGPQLSTPLVRIIGVAEPAQASFHTRIVANWTDSQPPGDQS